MTMTATNPVLLSMPTGIVDNCYVTMTLRRKKTKKKKEKTVVDLGVLSMPPGNIIDSNTMPLQG